MQHSRLKAAAFLFAIFLALFASAAHAQKSGAYYWGDGDGSGSMAGPDLNVLYQVLANPGVNDSIIYGGYPQSRYRQDLDGNGSIAGPDANVMYGWAAGNFSNRPGNPDRLLLDGTTNLSVQIGDSVTLQAYALSPASVASALRTGFGVNFQIIGGTCTTNAQIYGYNVAGGSTVNAWRNPSAYHYLPTRLAPDNGRAWVKVRGNTCTDGQTTIIKVYIPSDAHSGSSGSRFSSDLVAQLTPLISTPVNFTITWASGTPPHTSIDSYPPSLDNSANANFTFICDQSSCTYECNIDSLGWSSCSSPQGYNGVADGAHLFSVRATSGGLTDPTPPSYAWTIDVTPPDTQITGQPPSLTNQQGATFTFTCTDAHTPCSFQCSMDSGAFTTCASPANYSGLSEASHTFQVLATDGAGNPDPTPASFSWIIDLTPPYTTITNNPNAPTNNTSAIFEFTCNKSPCTFACSLDSGSYAPCVSPKSYSGLSDGPHAFLVRATDQAGNVDQTPASFIWSIDTIPPETIITSDPLDPTNQRSAAFSFTCNEGNCTFQCRIDAEDWSECSSPKNYTGLSDDIHFFEVIATDAADNIALLPASYSWTVDTIPPNTTITSKPSSLTNSTSATFGFTCTESNCTFQCRLDAGGWSSCSSPQSYSSLIGGTHSFQVRARDQAGNADPTPANYSWTIDLTPPDTFITSNPANPTNQTSASFSFTCTDAHTPCTFECNLDSDGWSACSSPLTYHNPWAATSTAGAPSGRYQHTAVWTGTEMIVWGGWGNSGLLNTGGRYNPATDSWTPTSTDTNVPAPRSDHTAVWTGTEMIIWGGDNEEMVFFNTGGRYNPTTNTWTATSTSNAPARTSHTAVWTGTEMIVWGGENGSDYLNTGGRYNPTTNSWTATSTTNAPGARFYHTAVWTGTKMIIWGGWTYYGDDSYNFFNTGGIYNPTTNTWTATSITNAPAARESHTAVWTGAEMIIWGGFNYYDGDLNTGGRYNPTTNSWTATSTTNAPAARENHTAVWTGTKMIVWGGFYYGPYNFLNTGGNYYPATDSWSATSTINAPTVREYHTAVWDGAEMIIWGGYDGASNLNTGGRYGFGISSDGSHLFAVRAYDAALNVDPTPATYSWTIDLTPPITSLTSAPPDPNDSSDALFEFDCSETGCSFECNLDRGAWTTCSSPWGYLSLPSGEHIFSVRATDAAGNPESDPLVYPWTISINPPDTYITSHPTNPTTSTSASFGFDCSAGPCTFECNFDSEGWTSCASPVDYTDLSDGSHTFRVRARDAGNNVDLTPASYGWTIDTTAPDTMITSAPASHSNTTDASFSFTCDDTGCTFKCRIDSGSWTDCTSPQNYSGLTPDSHTFDVYATDWVGNTDLTPASFSWTIDLTPPDTFITDHPPDLSNSGNASFSFICDEPPCTFACNLDSTAWTACSSPKTYGNNSWTETSTTDAPEARYSHTAVWTGTEMIVWGGYGDTGPVNSGGRYDPATDSWTATSLTNAPEARYYHTAVWTSTEMIVWGGYNNANGMNTGGRYNPAIDSWTATSTINAPEGRFYHTAVWTGTEMIVWGGPGGSGELNTGGRYDPETDSWTATSLTNAPEGRYSHTAVWTDTEMIVWGGYGDTGLVNTGGRYDPETDSWTATSTINAPEGRYSHTAVWTSAEMIVWGGFGGPGYLNTGGRYDPEADSWTATSTINAPEGRFYHTAVWTSTEMIVWGGYNNANGMNTGGSYNPVTDFWVATSITNAPVPRMDHTAIWTGTEMIVWGGCYWDAFYTGGIYDPPLSDGSHTFAVRAYDEALNVDLSPAFYSWTIDATPPITSLTSTPDNPTSSTDATFEFNCNETGCTFECNLDGAGWSVCDSPSEYLGLSWGYHIFSVRATDPAGNLEITPLTYFWDIEP